MKRNRYGRVVRSESISKDRENFFNNEVVVSTKKEEKRERRINESNE